MTIAFIAWIENNIINKIVSCLEENDEININGFITLEWEN